MVVSKTQFALGFLFCYCSSEIFGFVPPTFFKQPTTGTSLPIRPLFVSSPSSSRSSTGRSNKKGGGRGKNTSNKHSNKKSNVRKIVKPSGPRPVVTVYKENRGDWINEMRLKDEIGCEHFGTCPGCVVNDNVSKVDSIQSARLYFSSTGVRRKRLDVERSGADPVIEEADDGFFKVVVPSDVVRWRSQAKLAVAPKTSAWDKDGCIFGLYQKGTHHVLPIPACQVHHPSINRAVEALVKATKKTGTSAYQEDTREGGLRYVQFQVERTTRKICLTLVWNTPEVKYATAAVSRLTKELNKLEPDLWHSMWCHCNDGPGNNIFSRNARNWYRISGPEFVREPLPVGDQGWLYFSPLAFRQGNLDGFDILANDVARAVPGGSKVCELYAGVGVLGLTALAYHAQQGKNNDPLVWVRCSDENPANQRCFNRSFDSLPREISHYKVSVENQKEFTIAEIAAQMEAGLDPYDEDRNGPKSTYMVADAAEALKAGQALGASVLIVDPPRKGLDDEVLDELCKRVNPNQPCVESAAVMPIPDEQVNWTNDIQTLIYVSCGFDALARDCEKLLSSNGGWMVESATGYALFPGSDHVETICILKRS